MRGWCAVAVVFLVGCSGAPQHCAARSGAYVLQLKQRTGNCGAVSDQVVIVSGSAQSEPPDGCTGGSQYTANNCDGDLDVTCPVKPSGTTRTKGHVEWNADGSRATGIVQLTVFSPNGSVACDSTYDATYQRQ